MGGCHPIVVFSFDEPFRAEPHRHTVEFPGLKALEFNFASVQLNQFNWRDYLNQRNPVAAALMAKMRIAPGDHPKVKAECLRLLATLRLDPARTRLISGFVDTYLRLSQQEEQVFQEEVGKLEETEQESVMEIVTSWMEQGIEQGIERGIEQDARQEARSLIQRLLTRRLGALPDSVGSQIDTLSITQLESLAEALLDFSSLSALLTFHGMWKKENGSRSIFANHCSTGEEHLTAQPGLPHAKVITDESEWLKLA